MKIACLHTLQSNVDIFETARTSGITLIHTVRADLLDRAEAAGGITEQVELDTVGILLELAAAADGVLLTCSSIGPCVRRAATLTSVPILRADESLARASVAQGGTVIVLCAAPTTVTPSRAIFEAAGKENGAIIETILVDGAWQAFRAGDLTRYNNVIAQAADAMAESNNVATIAFAQASMSAASRFCKVAKPLTSPSSGIAAIVNSVGATRAVGHA